MSKLSKAVSTAFVQSPNRTVGNWTKRRIVLHWWDDPAKRPAFNGVVTWFQNRAAKVSAQYVVEHNRVTQMVHEKDMAWHAGNGDVNRDSIGIEINPRLSDGDYQTTAELIADIWTRHGKLPLDPHRKFTGTNCPGTLDIPRLQRMAEAVYSGGSVVKPAAPRPTAPSKGSGPRKAGSGPWPSAYLTPTDKFNEWQEKALYKLLGDAGYVGTTLAIRLQKRLRASGDYKGQITGKSRIGPQTVRAWQSFLKVRGYYKGKVTVFSRWGPQTNRATVAFLNDQAHEYHK